MVIEAFEERFGGLVKKVTDLGPQITTADLGVINLGGNNGKMLVHHPQIVIEFANWSDATHIRVDLSYARAKNPDEVVVTNVEYDSNKAHLPVGAMLFEGEDGSGFKTSDYVLQGEKINEQRITTGNWFKRTTWRWKQGPPRDGGPGDGGFGNGEPPPSLKAKEPLIGGVHKR